MRCRAKRPVIGFRLRLGGPPQHAMQDAALHCCHTRVVGLARAGNVDVLIQSNAPVLDQNDAVRKRHSFLHIVGDSNPVKPLCSQKSSISRCILNADQRAQWLVQQQQARIVNQRAC